MNKNYFGITAYGKFFFGESKDVGDNEDRSYIFGKTYSVKHEKFYKDLVNEHGIYFMFYFYWGGYRNVYNGSR